MFYYCNLKYISDNWVFFSYSGQLLYGGLVSFSWFYSDLTKYARFDLFYKTKQKKMWIVKYRHKYGKKDLAPKCINSVAIPHVGHLEHNILFD